LNFGGVNSSGGCKTLSSSGDWKDLDDLKIATCASISWFNEEGIHGELDDFTPAEVEADYIVKPQVNAA